MCQPKSKGGKRCAAHQPAAIAVKASVGARSRLEKGQIDYAFKMLKERGRDEEAPTKKEYKEFLRSQLEDIKKLDLDAKLVAALEAKYAKAIEDAQPPSGDMYYAIKNLDDQSKRVWRSLATQLRKQSQKTGDTPAQSLKKFKKIYEQTVTPRNQNANGNLDAKTLVVLERMEADSAPQLEETPRITRQPTGRKTLCAAGYDEEDGRLEVEMSTGDVYALRGVSSEDYERFQQAPVAVFNELRAEPAHHYESASEAALDAYRVWCEKCSRYRLASGHVCRGGNVYGVHVSRTDELYNKGLEEVRNAVDQSMSKMIPSAHLTPVNQRKVVKFPVEYGRSNRSAPNSNKIIEELRKGNAVKFDLAVRGKIRGTTPPEYFEVTRSFNMSTCQGNRNLLFNVSDYKCSCDQFKKNQWCSHTDYGYDSDHPSYKISALANTLMRRLRAASFYEVRSKPSGGAVIATGNDGKKLTPEEASMVYQLLLEDEEVRIIADGQTSWVRVSEKGKLEVSRTNGSAVRRNLESVMSKQEFQELFKNREQLEKLDGWETNPSSRQAYLDRFGENKAKDGYLTNTETFLEDYKEARSKACNSQIEFVEGSVTGGYLSTSPDEPNARGFGIEIEFDQANAKKVAKALQEAGLSQSNEVAYYHSKNKYDSWRVEYDCSVDGEIVSPILYDNKESWEQVRKVCEIAKSLNAKASINTGNHVHIGTKGMKAKEKKGVLAAVVANQDVIRRLSTSPSRKKHRSDRSEEQYSVPFHREEVQDIYRSRAKKKIPASRYRIANFVNDNTIEFRDPDGTLDPGHIQAQVMLSAALVAAGERGKWDDLQGPSVSIQRVGANKIRESYIKDITDNEDDQLIASNISLMSSLDALFPDRDTRRRMLDVAVRVPWQKTPPPEEQ